MKIHDLKYRTKLIVFFSLSLLIILLACLYMYLTLQRLTQDTTDMFEKNVVLTDVYRKLGLMQTDLEAYLTTNDSDSLLSFYNNVNAIQPLTRTMKTSTISDMGDVRLKNTANMIENYLSEAEKAIIAKRGRNIDSYTEYFALAKRHNQMILRYIDELMSATLIANTDGYSAIAERIRLATLFNITLTASVIGLVMFLIVGFSREITRPVTELAQYAKEITNGNYQLDVVPTRQSDEIGILYDAFSRMVSSVRDYISTIQENARLEASNLKMQTALREAELLALQSQVNPHFIFNTINIGARIAHLQNDPVTCEYLENTASIFRYNLRGLDTPATIMEEIQNAKAYLSLLKTRFGDQLEYAFEYDADSIALATHLPRMTLQPLVENAYIHGISGLERPGEITIRIEETDSHILVSIIDNGVGIPDATIQRIEAEAVAPLHHHTHDPEHGHTTGIGLSNVLQRLRLHFMTLEVLTVVSREGFTALTLNLPKGVPPCIES